MSHNTSIVTRFAPSPTGYLHIGSARTALFNYLFAKRMGGKFLLRIEDTDRERSTDESIQAILDGLKWMGIDWDQDPIYQFARRERHKEVALEMLEKDLAYYCYSSPQELDEMREKAKAEGRQPRYDGRWRDRSPADAPKDIQPVVRIKAPQTGETVVNDLVQGTVTVANENLDDFVLLRSDGTPTYMLSVVVDDHDMGITHIIRGDDHLTNTFRQKHIYQAMGWEMPSVSHISLIHGADGAKLSKRHGALGVEAYEHMGILPEALCNYLVRLGWSHGDDEIISREQAIAWFNIESIGKSASRFDMDKLLFLNAHYLRQKESAELIDLIRPFLKELGIETLAPHHIDRLTKGMQGLKDRAKDLRELAQNALIYCQDIPYPFDEKAQEILTPQAKEALQAALSSLDTLSDWTEEAIEESLRQLATQRELKFGQIAQPLRAALTGKAVSPSIFEIMSIINKQETISRLKYVIDL